MTLGFAIAPFKTLSSLKLSFDVLADKKKNTIYVQWFVVIATAYLSLFKEGQIVQDLSRYLLVLAALGLMTAFQRLSPSTFDHPLFCQALVILDTL